MGCVVGQFVPYHYRRTSRRQAFWALGVAALVVLVVVGVMVASQRDDDADRDSSAVASDRPTERDRDRDQRGRVDDKRRKAGPGGAEAPPSWLAGVPDLGTVVPGGPHRAVLTVTSGSGAAVGVRYAFRTGASYRDGTVTASGSWRGTETVRGHEPLAGVIAQVASGSVTCTATLDGRVISTRTSSGQFATVLCAA